MTLPAAAPIGAREMKSKRTFQTADPATRVHFLRADGSEVVVTHDGYTTSDPYEIAHLMSITQVSETKGLTRDKPKQEEDQ